MHHHQSNPSSNPLNGPITLLRVKAARRVLSSNNLGIKSQAPLIPPRLSVTPKPNGPPISFLSSSWRTSLKTLAMEHQLPIRNRPPLSLGIATDRLGTGNVSDGISAHPGSVDP